MSRWTIAGGIIAVILIITFTVWQFRGNSQHATGESLSIPSDWKLFTDPHGYVSFKIPPTWDSKVAGGATLGLGDVQGGEQLSLMSYSLQDSQANAISSVSATRIKLSVGPWPSESMRRYMCQQRPTDAQLHQVGTLQGMESNRTIDLLTQRAFIRIAYTYPGAPGVTSPGAIKRGDEPTPVSDAQSAAGKHIIDLILSSFQAIPNELMSC